MSVETVGRGRVLAIGAAAVSLLTFVVVATVIADRDAAQSAPRPERHFRADATGIPGDYQELIVAAGTACPDREHVTQALVAAILKAESDFDPDLSDPATHEYGIARWTQAMLRENLPAGERSELITPPFPPEVSIPAVGELLCKLSAEPAVAGDRRGPELGLAFGFRASIRYGRVIGGTEPGWSGDAAYVGRVEQALAAYRPE